MSGIGEIGANSQLLNPFPGDPKSTRSWFRQYLILTVGTAKRTYALMRDNTDASAEPDWEETDEMNVREEMTSSNVMTAVTVDVDKYIARAGDPLTHQLLDMYFKRKGLDDIQAQYGEVYLEKLGDAPMKVMFANVQDCVLLIQGIGGESTDGVDIPFTLKITGTPTDANPTSTTAYPRFDIPTESFQFAAA